jgi:hypothetical protein
MIDVIKRRVRKEGSSALGTIGKVGALVGAAAGTALTAGGASPALVAAAGGLAAGGAATNQFGGEREVAPGAQPQAISASNPIERRQGEEYQSQSPVLADSLKALQESDDEMRAKYSEPLTKAYVMSLRNDYKRGLA